MATMFDTPTRLRVLSYLSVAAGVLTLVATLAGGLTLWQHKDMTLQMGPVEVTRLEIPRYREELQLVENRLTKLESHMSGLANIPTDSKIALQLKTIQSSLDTTSSEVAALDKAIMESPVKALEIPLLRKDMDNMKDNNQANVEAVKDEINRVYGLGEWFIGLMATMAVGVLSLAVTNFLSRPKKETP